jgi:hypothetical protein
LGLGQLNPPAVYKRLRPAIQRNHSSAGHTRASLGFTAPKLVRRVRAVDATPGLAPSEQVLAVALRNTLPEYLATAARTSIVVEFIRDRLDLSGAEGASLVA